MDPLEAQKYRAMDEWFKSPQGTAIAEAFALELNFIDKWLNGDTFLQLGSCGENIWMPFMRFNHKLIITPFLNNKVDLIGSLHKIPLDRETVDCVLAPLTMEASTNDVVLDEIDRVLRPMGIAIFFGVNPMSLWGLALKWGYLDCFGKTNVRLYSSLSLKRSMGYRGFRSSIHKNFYFIPPVLSENIISRLNFLNEMGKMIWPFPAGFYCLVLQKYQFQTEVGVEQEDLYYDDEIELELI